MNHIQTTTAETPTDSYSVEFYPSADDYAYIASTISKSVPVPPLIKYSYQLFLIVNAVFFPAFLWLNEFLIAGILVAALNVIALSRILPWVSSTGLRKFYDHVFRNRESEVARVEITSEGIHYSANGAETFWPWQRINAIEESDESIYFFFDGNGIAVRKSGFAYRDQQMEFLGFARQALEEHRSREIVQ